MVWRTVGLGCLKVKGGGNIEIYRRIFFKEHNHEEKWELIRENTWAVEEKKKYI